MELRFTASGSLSLDIVRLQNFVTEALGGIAILDNVDREVCGELLDRLDTLPEFSEPDRLVASIVGSLTWASRQSKTWHCVIEDSWLALQAENQYGSKVVDESIWFTHFHRAHRTLVDTLLWLLSRKFEAPVQVNLQESLDLSKCYVVPNVYSQDRWPQQGLHLPHEFSTMTGNVTLNLSFRDPVQLDAVTVDVHGSASVSLLVDSEDGPYEVGADQFQSGRVYWIRQRGVTRMRLIMNSAGRRITLNRLSLLGQSFVDDDDFEEVVPLVRIFSNELVYVDALEGLAALRDSFAHTLIGDLGFLEACKAQNRTLMELRGAAAIGPIISFLDFVTSSAPACACWIMDDLERVLPDLQRQEVQLALTLDAFDEQASRLTHEIGGILYLREEALLRYEPPATASVKVTMGVLDWNTIEYLQPLVAGKGLELPTEWSSTRTVSINDLEPIETPTEMLVPVLYTSDRSLMDTDTLLPTGDFEQDFDLQVYALAQVAIPKRWREMGPATGYILHRFQYISRSSFLELLAQVEADRRTGDPKLQIGHLPPTTTVHGFNTSAPKGLVQGILFAMDVLRLQGLAVVRAWASKGKLDQLLTDYVQAQSSASSFARLLKLMLANNGAGHLNLFAHSMGCVVSAQALRELQITGAKRQPWSLRTLVACASVTAAGYWGESIKQLNERLLENERPLVRSVRYVAPCDVAVSAFDRLAGGGQKDRNSVEPLSVGVETVDVSQALFLHTPDWVSHSYHTWVPGVLFDLYHVFCGTGKEMEYRRVVEGLSGQYFVLPPTQSAFL